MKLTNLVSGYLSEAKDWLLDEELICEDIEGSINTLGKIEFRISNPSNKSVIIPYFVENSLTSIEVTPVMGYPISPFIFYVRLELKDSSSVQDNTSFLIFSPWLGGSPIRRKPLDWDLVHDLESSESEPICVPNFIAVKDSELFKVGIESLNEAFGLAVLTMGYAEFAKQIDSFEKCVNDAWSQYLSYLPESTSSE